MCCNAAMTTDDIIKHYGTMKAAMKALQPHGIYHSKFYNWKRTGIPEGMQYKVQVITGGKLKVDAL